MMHRCYTIFVRNNVDLGESNDFCRVPELTRKDYFEALSRLSCEVLVR